ncbi:MAG: division/cell wall cluster transcriptional repressor MraZ [Gammaproteobacteria bacterium]|nr:division/cell wall cluster transcriptional repressor MraZ [Gammaproteobacteria bacterium]
MLSGHTVLNLDTKGRLAIPTRYRSYLNESSAGKFSVTVHPDICLMLYPYHEWGTVQEKVMKLSNMNRKARDLQRLIIGYAAELDMDGNGRLLLPPSLREFAKLDKHVVLIGVGNKFELWDERRWTDRQNEWLSDGESQGSLSDELQSLSL